MIRLKNKETVSVYFRGVSIAQIYYKGALIWPEDDDDLSCFHTNGGWNDDLPWNDEVNWID